MNESEDGSVVHGAGESGQPDATDGVRIVRNFPAKSIGIREVATVAAPVSTLGVVHVGSSDASRVQGSVYLGGGGNIVSESEGQRTAPPDRSELLFCLGFGPQGQHELVAHVNHEHLVRDVESSRPAQATYVEPSGALEILDDEGHEMNARLHGSVLPRSERSTTRSMPGKAAPLPETSSFRTPRELEAWLRKYHATQSELWVRIFKKDSGTPSVNWKDCVLAALAWGWIDGQKRALDEVSFLQRLTPRRPQSSWSKINCAHAERLIEEGRMQPPGLKAVEAARGDGRWARAYAGSATMTIPEDFLRELTKHPAAQATFATLDRRNLFAIYHRLETAKRPETRARRMAGMIADLAAGRKFH